MWTWIILRRKATVIGGGLGLSPLEVESLVTRPIELSLTGLPGAEKIRSVSRTAVSAITIVFQIGRAHV